ncbi:MAG: ABC transporter permease [Chitinophagaceae bacterium]|nr:ABC transporter permease [Chitinophagaceae bacterium]
MKFPDVISLSYRTIRSNRLRTGITVSIIALGIAALIGIRTAIEAMTQKFTESFSSMGANGFSIRYKPSWQVNFNRGVVKEDTRKRKQKKSNTDKRITREQAESFKENFRFPAQVGLSFSGKRNSTITYNTKKTGPNVYILGGDENYLDLNGYSVAYGRNIGVKDVSSGALVCLIGKDVAVKLFGDDNLEKPVDRIVRVNNIALRVIGTLNPKGSTLGRSWDNCIVTSYINVQRFFPNSDNASFSIGVKVPDVKFLQSGIGEAQGVFRPLRRLTSLEEDNFVVDKSDSFVEMLLRQLSMLTIAALVIGFITLVGAAIGLMNIMLVAVSERTKEIGLVKAIGGKQQNIRQQFLYESVIISLLGAVFGIIAGILLGNIVSLLMNTGFVVPWGWVAFGVFICSIVGLGAGLYPALKASRLNPIEALRYE